MYKVESWRRTGEHTFPIWFGAENVILSLFYLYSTVRNTAFVKQSLKEENKTPNKQMMFDVKSNILEKSTFSCIFPSTLVGHN